MRITTNRGKTFDVNYAFAPTSKGTCMMEILDNRPIAEVAADFDGLETISRESENEGNAVYTGYDTLVSVFRNTAKGTVQLTLERSDAA